MVADREVRRAVHTATRGQSWAHETQFFKSETQPQRMQSFAVPDSVPGFTKRRDVWVEAELASRMTLVSKEERWARDVLAIPHNGIRKELVGLYIMLESIYCRSLAISALELEDFFSWFDEFEAYLNEYFRFEDRMLFPLLKSWDVTVSRPYVIQGKSRAEMRLDLASLLTEVAKCSTLALDKHAKADMIDVLYKVGLEIPPLIMEYFRQQETFLPAQIEKQANTERIQVLRRCYWEYVRTCCNPAWTFHLTTRWISDPALLSSLENRFCEDKRPILKMLAKKRLRKEYKRVSQAHISPVQRYLLAVDVNADLPLAYLDY
uniref:Hemerythrin-like domain-containing protein n=1 Tax=Compsopogon caeruleus TaxID=31354 RepID=A0A7S1TJ03_9RHOD